MTTHQQSVRATEDQAQPPQVLPAEAPPSYELVLDRRLYPDVLEVPVPLDSDWAKADYLERFCSAWDFGIVPSGAMVLALGGWRDIATRFPLPHSPAYHALCIFFRWPRVPAAHSFTHALTQDEREGRGDPCENWF